MKPFLAAIIGLIIGMSGSASAQADQCTSAQVANCKELEARYPAWKGFEASYPAIKNCIDTGGDVDMCGMLLAKTENLAIIYREAALHSCRVNDAFMLLKEPQFQSTRREAIERRPICLKLRAYIKERWG